MKQLEPREVYVGDRKFYIRPFPAFKAANLSGELSAVLVPVFSVLIPIFTDNELLDKDLSQVAPTIAGAFTSLSGDKLEALLKKLLTESRNVTMEKEDGKAEILTEDSANEIFCEDVDEMFLLAVEVIRTNYSGFFEKLGVPFGEAEET